MKQFYDKQIHGAIKHYTIITTLLHSEQSLEHDKKLNEFSNTHHVWYERSAVTSVGVQNILTLVTFVSYTELQENITGGKTK